MNKLILSTTLAALLAVGFSTNLVADSNDAATATAQQNAEVSMAQAIAIATQATGGENTDAEFELEDGKSIYEIEIKMVDGSEVEVTVDAQSGLVLSQEAEDDDEGSDKDDDPAEDDGDKD